jgi:hypothetical protein
MIVANALVTAVEALRAGVVVGAIEVCADHSWHFDIVSWCFVKSRRILNFAGRMVV